MSKRQSKATEQANLAKASERAAAIRAEQERKERRTRLFVVAAVVVAILLIVVALTWALSRSGDTGKSSAPPAGAVDTYTLPMGPDDAPVTVTVYEDMMCPFCGDFEQLSSEGLKEYAASGDVQVRYHVVSFLDAQSADDYSTRAANAVAVVLDTAGPEVAVEFHDALFENQPAEGGAGLSDEQMIDLAVEAGATEDEIAGPIEDLAFEQWVIDATEDWSASGFRGTPAVTVNGETVESTDIPGLVAGTEQAIEDALAVQ